MGETFLDRHGIKSGIKLNDVIEEFKYVYKGQTIKAGDFVNYINGVAGKTDYGESVDTQLSTEANSGYAISAVQLDENRVFIVHRNSNNYLSGLVCTISGATITVGADTELPTSTVAYEAFSICLLQNGNVFVAYRDNSTGSTNKYLYGIVVSINGTTITTGVKTSLVTTQNSGYTISTCLLPNGNVFIAHCYSSNYYLNGIVVSIDGTTITKGTDTALVSSSYAGYVTSTCLLPNGNVFIAHSYGSNYYLYGIVCTISGTTITKGSDTALISTKHVGDVISTCLLPNGNVFIAHSPTGSAGLYGMVVSISGTTITKGTDTELSTVTYAGYEISTCLLPNGNVFIAHRYSNTYYLYGIVVTIDDTTITAGSDTALISEAGYTGYEISAIMLNNGTIFIAHSRTSGSYYLYAQIFGIDYENNIPTNHITITEYEQQVTPAIEPPFNAVALSSGVGAPEYVEVEVEKEVTKTGNAFPTSWTSTTNLNATSENGYTLTANSASSLITEARDVRYVSDGNDSTYFIPKSVTTSSYTWNITMICPKMLKITKMKTYISALGSGTSKIQGSTDGATWVDLYTISSKQSALTELTLENIGYYKYYRISTGFTIGGTATVKEWQTSEYMEIEKEIQQIPSTEHNEQVKIARPNVGVI